MSWFFPAGTKIILAKVPHCPKPFPPVFTALRAKHGQPINPLMFLNIPSVRIMNKIRTCCRPQEWNYFQSTGGGVHLAHLYSGFGASIKVVLWHYWKASNACWRAHESLTFAHHLYIAVNCFFDLVPAHSAGANQRRARSRDASGGHAEPCHPARKRPPVGAAGI